MNPALAPRAQRCVLCREVGAIEHVALLLYDEDLGKLPTRPAIEYLRSLGSSGSPQTLYNRIIRHRNHIDRWLERGAKVIPAAIDNGVQRIPPPTGPVRWIDAQENAIALGNDAIRDLNVRLASGELETRDVIALAKLGVGAANVRGGMEQKGKALNSIDQLLRLAAGGVGRPAEEPG